MSYNGKIKVSLTVGFEFDYDITQLLDTIIDSGEYIDEPSQQKDGSYEFVYYHDEYFDQDDFNSNCDDFMCELVDILAERDPDQERYDDYWNRDSGTFGSDNPKPYFNLVIEGTFYNEGSGGNYVDKAKYTAFVENGVDILGDFIFESGYKG